MPDKLSEVILIMVGSTMIILALTSLVVTSLVISRKRKFRHNMEMADLKNTYERELLRVQLEIQAETFQTISRELHDNVGTLLSIATVHVRSVTESHNRNETKKMEEVQGLLNEAMDILRDISKSLNPETITTLGWQKSFFNELQRIGRSNVFSIKTSVRGVPFEIEPAKQILLFRILQETINNIVKHAEATEVYVDLVYEENGMNINIADNGKGFSEEGAVPEGSGLKNMRARASMLPANLRINSHSGKGTVMNIYINRN
jgi:hypothetical protein